MSRKTLLVLVLVAAFVFVLSAPRQAQATNTGEIALYAAIGVVGVIAISAVATYYVYGTKPHMMLPGPDPLQLQRKPEPRLRFGLRCQQKDGNLPLVCW